MIDPTEVVLRLLFVFGLAFSVGLERQLHRKPVGLGTFIFVSMGAATLAILAITLEEANPLSAQDLDGMLPPSFARFERIHVDKEAHQVSVTAQVRLKPGDVAGLLDALRRNEKVRKFEVE